MVQRTHCSFNSFSSNYKFHPPWGAFGYPANFQAKEQCVRCTLICKPDHRVLICR